MEKSVELEKLELHSLTNTEMFEKKSIKNLKINTTLIGNLACLALSIGLGLVPFATIQCVADYQEQTRYSSPYLSLANLKTAEMMKDTSVEKVTITVVGNSISNGYSKNYDIIPLFIRNDEFSRLLAKRGIMFELHNFSRAQDNNDEKTLGLLISNKMESKVNRENRMDYQAPRSGMYSPKMTEEKLDEFYPNVVEEDKGLRDIVAENKENQANIIVYNGGTGIFLDSLTRGSESIFESFEQDRVSVDAFCHSVFLMNPNTQIYLCGIPNILNIGLTDGINAKYQELADKYLNVTYVKPSPVRMFYETATGIAVDIHPNEAEYKIYLKNIMNAVAENYVSNQVAIRLHTELAGLNNYIQFKNQELTGDVERTNQTMLSVLQDCKDRGMSEDMIARGVQKFNIYYTKTCGSNYSYTSKQDTLRYLSDVDKNIEEKPAQYITHKK